jgi:hypothetical protein
MTTHALDLDRLFLSPSTLRIKECPSDHHPGAAEISGRERGSPSWTASTSIGRSRGWVIGMPDIEMRRTHLLFVEEDRIRIAARYREAVDLRGLES